MIEEQQSNTRQARVLADFIQANQPLVVITGAGCSVASGIPTYRDNEGTWQRTTPILHQDFVNSASARQRYWTRSIAGWPAVAQAQPNRAHQSLTQLEAFGYCALLVTQNVDRLHQRAGHQTVIDLHGRIDRVHCMQCGQEIDRDDLQQILLSLNSKLSFEARQIAPDGDADLADSIIESVKVPNCERCNGTLKPSVVFYGDSVPTSIVEEIFRAIDSANGVLVVGSSLMVYSSFRFCRHAAQQNLPLAIVNSGKTRADDIASLKIEASCETVLLQALHYLKLGNT